MSLNARLKQVRIAQGWKGQEMADLFEIVLNSYYNLENDESKGLNDSYKLLLKENFGINLHWLITGDGHMYINQFFCSASDLKEGIEKLNTNLDKLHAKFDTLKNDDDQEQV